ncbi:hypothetical protein ACWDUI_07775 [Streptosporangium sandarakinum]|uniref:hypothetical protein n=1 Tax=Streptosporangium TaxID=2000 RepID=UPI0031F94B26
MDGVGKEAKRLAVRAEERLLWALRREQEAAESTEALRELRADMRGRGHVPPWLPGVAMSSASAPTLEHLDSDEPQVFLPDAGDLGALDPFSTGE